MSAARQGSASFTLVIGGLTMLLVGAIALTFFVYPIINGFLGSAFWGTAETAAGSRVQTFVKGAWIFSGGFMLVSIVLYIWINTRQ